MGEGIKNEVEAESARESRRQLLIDVARHKQIVEFGVKRNSPVALERQ